MNEEVKNIQFLAVDNVQPGKFLLLTSKKDPEIGEKLSMRLRGKYEFPYIEGQLNIIALRALALLVTREACAQEDHVFLSFNPHDFSLFLNEDFKHCSDVFILQQLMEVED